MLPICVRTERVWPKLSSIQGIRADLVYIVSLVLGQFFQIMVVSCKYCINSYNSNVTLFSYYSAKSATRFWEVSKSQNQFLALLFFQKTNERLDKNYPKTSQDIFFSCFVDFLQELRIQFFFSRSNDL